MFAGSFFSIFMYAEKAVVWTQRKEESMNVRFIGSVLALIWCFRASLKSTESVVLHVFDHFLGVAAVRHAFAREKQTERKKRNILLRTSETEQKKGRKYSRMFSRLSLFGHVWCVEGVSNYTCLCAGCRQILGARFMSDISIVEEGFLIHRHHESACFVCPNNSVCSF